MILGAINVAYFGEGTAHEKHSALRLVLRFRILTYSSKCTVLYYIGSQPVGSLSILKLY